MNDKVTHGMWSESESNSHINVLEIKAAMLGIQSLCQGVSHCHVRVEIDNTTAVSYINNMGGTHSKECNDITRELLLWCKSKNIWVSACHIPGKTNTETDACSRKKSINTE